MRIIRFALLMIRVFVHSYPYNLVWIIMIHMRTNYTRMLLVTLKQEADKTVYLQLDDKTMVLLVNL